MMNKELSRLFHAAVQDKPYAREKMAKLLDSLDVSRKEDRIKIDCLSEIAWNSGVSWYKAIRGTAQKGNPDAWYILAFCDFYGIIGRGSTGRIAWGLRIARYLENCKGHEDALRFWNDHIDAIDPG